LRGDIIAHVPATEHLLVAETGADDRSRYAIMVGVRVEDPPAVAELLADGEDNRVIAVLREVAFEVVIAFASKQKLEALGEDWRYAFIRELTSDRFNPNRHRLRSTGYPLVAYLPEGTSFDFAWVDAYLTNATYGQVRVQTKVVSQDERVLRLPRLVARLFHDAIEDDTGRPNPARDRYDALAPLVKHVEDVGLNVSYSGAGNTSDAFIRASMSD
jgi:hypothetical protein